ncbi:hypothetical protein [Chitinophaga sp. RAB17]|uniref:hypothetical protein n=1 Tax=Chitinophaga sp. RAB17 TaxID=3233049 RepID=UPI003F93F238
MSKSTSPKMMHSTYFSLSMGSTPALRDSYMEACSAYLSKSEGMLSFWVCKLAEDMFRLENDRNFNVAMNQVFENKEMFDKYNANDKEHSQFVIEVNRWAPGTGRRVYDSYLSHLIYGKDNKPAAPEQPPRLMHSIYFSLTDKSAASIKKFTDICVKYLSEHPGTCVFAIGELANLKRDVSIANYDVAMNILWKSKNDYSNYLKSKDHDAFFPATKGMVSDTYIFDSYVAEPPLVSGI